MADNNKPYDVLSVEEWADDNGEVKTRFRNVGVAFDNSNGDGQTLIIPSGISLSGKIITKQRRERTDGDAG